VRSLCITIACAAGMGMREEDSANLFAASSARMPCATYLSSVALAKEDQGAHRDANPRIIRPE
jgi:hypothetical protein